MEIISYNQELAYANMLFRRPFNNIKIFRDGKWIKFKCVIGNRSRILKGKENKDRNAQLELPMIIIQRMGITKAKERKANLHNEVKYKTGKSGLEINLYTPVPVNIQYQVTIVSKYQGDIDMCYSNFIPFFNDDIFVQSPHPKYKDLRFKSQIVMEDSITEDHPTDLDGTADDLITATCNFVYKTYIFGGTDQIDSSAARVVRKISTSISVDYETGLSTEISSIVDTTYNGFVPNIEKVLVDLYPIPYLSTDYVEHMERVDAITPEEYQEPWVDRFVWKVDESSLSATEEVEE